MTNDKSMWWAWTLKNSIALICWTVLAVIFRHWWIALFSLLFMAEVKTHYKTRNNEEDNKNA